MSVISTANFPKLLWPGLNKLWGLNYTDQEKHYTQMFDISSSEQQYEEDQQVTGFGLVPVKAQGTAITYDTHSQGYTKRYTHVPYGMGFIITHEEMMDNLYLKRGAARAKALARSFRITKETVAANVYLRAHNSSYTGADGKELAATDHPTLSGNQSNELAVAADMSEASIEDLCIQIAKAVDDRGLRISLKSQSLIIPPDLAYEATRILQSQLQSGTANNDVNALRVMGKFPKGIHANPFLTDVDAFYIRTDAPEGMKLIQREEPTFSQDGDFDTSNLKYKGYERFAIGWTDWRGLFTNGGGA